LHPRDHDLLLGSTRAPVSGSAAGERRR